EELWKQLGHKSDLSEASWPEADSSLLVDETVIIAIQVNGKMRGKIEVAKDQDKELVEKEALSQDNVIRALDGKAPKKVIVVPNRIVNIVA
ncbi:MAG: class I tRNA ligase family protein, partial [Alphaproteobacteria bacterium]|nr:class I tRNA ligase family protein [Alphaproteobacteria bacterium]